MAANWFHAISSVDMLPFPRKESIKVPVNQTYHYDFLSTVGVNRGQRINGILPNCFIFEPVSVLGLSWHNFTEPHTFS